MTKQRKSFGWRWALLIGVCLGFAIATVQHVLGLPRETVMRVYWIVAPVLVLIAVLVNVVWQMGFRRKVARLTPILTHQRDPDRYIAEISKLLERVRHPYNRGTLFINLSAGYADKQDYMKAKQVLMQVMPEKLPGVLSAIYWNNLAYMHFHLGENAQGIEIMNRQEKLFEKWGNHPSLAQYLELTRAYQLLAQGDSEGVRRLLERHTPHSDARIQEDWQRVRARLDLLLSDEKP